MSERSDEEREGQINVSVETISVSMRDGRKKTGRDEGGEREEV